MIGPGCPGAHGSQRAGDGRPDRRCDRPGRCRPPTSKSRFP